MENLNSKEQVLKYIYYNLSKPGSFGGKESLLREAKKLRSDITRKDVDEWLSGELVYTLHKPIIKKFKRNKIISQQPGMKMQADLVDMIQFSRDNDNYQYILTAIDVFSKKAFALAIKNKSQNEVCGAMEKILKLHNTIELMTDNGLEFKNNSFATLMKNYNINHYFTKNVEIKCSIVERFNKTLKNKMFRYFTLKGNRRYIDKLDEMIESYNNSYHSSIKMKPSEVNENNVSQVFKNLYGFNTMRDYLKSFVKPKMTPGASVRIKHKLGVHDRGYYPYWTDTVYEIYKTLPGYKKPYYILKNDRGEVQSKRFYPTEIQKIKPNLYRVEKVIKQKTISGKKKFFVKWLNFPESYNSWIDATDLTDING